MKILIITQYFYPENFRVNTLAKELVKRGNEVTVLTGYPQYPKGRIYDGYGFDISYEKNWNGVDVERIKVKPRGSTPLGLFINCLTFVTEGYKWVKKCDVKYDAVYVFEVSPVTVGLPAIKYKEKFNTPVFFNVQDLWPENVEEILGIHNKFIIGLINRIVDKIYNNSDKILCASQGFVENIANRGIDRRKLVFWPQFCESPDFENLVSPPIYSDEYFNIVFTGNIGDAQGLDLMMDVADSMRNHLVKWFLVGDGRAKERLLKIVEERKLKEQVVFIGRVSETEANSYVRYADCAYLSFKDSSLFDLTIPAKLQTYLSCGTPILGAVAGESAEIIETSGGGIVSNKNVDSIKIAVENMMHLDTEKKNNMKKGAINYFENNFSMDKLISELLSMMRTGYESFTD